MLNKSGQIRPKRFEITEKDMEAVMSAFKTQLEAAFKKHGRGACWSMHEAGHMMTEEKIEVFDEIQANNIDGFFRESIDVMIAGFWSAASVVAGGIVKEWD
jgi:hypothetical protein